jgi:hypothetical protein
MRKAYKVILGTVGALVLALALGLSLWVGGNAGRKEWVKAPETSDAKSGTDADDPLGCRKMRDKWGRPYKLVRYNDIPTCMQDHPPWYYEELERAPVWVIRGKKVWADDWTPCPLPIRAERCDEIRERVPLGGGIKWDKVCVYTAGRRLVHQIDVIEGPETGDFLLVGYGDGAAVVGLRLVTEWLRDLPGVADLREEDTFIEDVRSQDFVIVECRPQGNISFELLDEAGKPLERKWFVRTKDFSDSLSCPEGMKHRVCNVPADHDVEVVFEIDGMAPEYRTVRAKKGQTTHEVFVISTQKTTAIEGWVWDAETGKPLANVSIGIYPLADWSQRRYDNHFSTMTDAAGHFKVIGVEPGPVESVHAHIYRWQPTSYNYKIVPEGKTLVLNFPLQKGTAVRSVELDPEPIISGRDEGCVPEEDLPAGARKYIWNQLDQGFSGLGNCLGLDNPEIQRLRNYYDSNGHKQKICVFDPSQPPPQLPQLPPDTIAYVTNSIASNNWDKTIYVSKNYVCDPYLADEFLHEFVHLGSDLNANDPVQVVQLEVDAYACEFVCAVDRGDELGLPAPSLIDVKYPCGAIPSPSQYDACTPMNWSWEDLFWSSAVFGLEGCPARVVSPQFANTAGFACQPSPSGLNEPPVCELCCPATGVDASCNPNMKCWMDFAPQSPQGQLEFKELCQSLGLSGTDCTHNLPACVKGRCKV